VTNDSEISDISNDKKKIESTVEITEWVSQFDLELILQLIQISIGIAVNHLLCVPMLLVARTCILSFDCIYFYYSTAKVNVQIA